MGNYGIDWDWLGTFGLALFWMLIIVLALAPTKYLLAELHSLELQGDPGDGPTPDAAPRKFP